MTSKIRLDSQVQGTLPRYSTTFDATTDWGAASGGYYTLTIAAATHAKTNPITHLYKLNGSDYDLIIPEWITVMSNGDVRLKVPDSPDSRFAGKLVVM